MMSWRSFFVFDTEYRGDSLEEPSGFPPPEILEGVLLQRKIAYFQTMLMEDTTNSPFCSSDMGGGMIMYMDGFRFALHGGQPCLNLLFPSWTLDTRTKFLMAMLGTTLVSVAVEGVSKLRHCIIRSAKSTYRSPGRSQWTLMVLRFAISGMHGAQALLGYIVMLATMTFSVELLFCVIFGLSLGYGIFFKPADVFQEAGHVTTNPCCAFMEEEVKDLRSMEVDEDANSSAPSMTATEPSSVVPPGAAGGSGMRYRNPV